MTAIGTTLLGRAEDDAVAMRYGENSWTYSELAAEGWRRAAAFRPG